MATEKHSGSNTSNPVPTKLLLCESQIRAERTREVLGLGDEWMVRGFGAHLSGRRFEVVAVMLQGDRPITSMEQQYLSYAKCLVAIGGRWVVLN